MGRVRVNQLKNNPICYFSTLASQQSISVEKNQIIVSNNISVEIVNAELIRRRVSCFLFEN